MPAYRTVTRLADQDDAALAPPGADRIVFWDDSAGKFTHLTPGTGLSISGTTLTATGGGGGGSPGETDVATLATAGDGTAGNPYTGWNAAFDALIADGAAFLFRGVFHSSAPLVLDNHSNVTLRGLSGRLGQMAFNTPAVGLPYSAILFSGAFADDVTAINSVGITIEGLTLKHDTALTLTGAVLTVSGGSAGNVSLGLVLRSVVLDAAAEFGDGTPLCCLNLDNTVETRLDGVVFYGARYGIVGTLLYPYATAVTAVGCRFESQTQAPILNPNFQWWLENIVFEPGAAANGKWVLASAGSVKNLTFANCYQWDSAGGGDVLALNVDSANVALIGCTTSTSTGRVVAPGDGNVIDGLTLIGCSFENNLAGAGHGTLFPESGWSSSRVHRASVSGNTFQAGIDNIASAVSGGQLVDGLVIDSAGTLLLPSVSGTGTVTSTSVVTANGFGGTVANPTTAPAITLTTSVTGILRGNGTAISAATAGTDYLAPNGNGSALTGLTESQVSGLTSDLAGINSSIAGKAPLASPALTGVPTVPTATAGTNTTQAASTAFVLANAGGGGGGTPGGADTQVQFNDAGAFGGDAGLTYNKTTNVLTITSGGITVPAAGTESEAYGSGASAAGNYSLAVGHGASAGGTNNCLAVGWGATANNNQNTALGRGAQATGNGALALGDATLASGLTAIAVGSSSSATGVDATAVGVSAAATADFALAFGRGATASHTSSIVFAINGSSTAADQMTVGSPTGPINQLTLGSPSAIADAAAVNNSLFVGSDHTGKLCWKDGSSVVHELY